MTQLELVRRIDAPATAVWDLLSWHGVAQLVDDGLFEGMDFDGEQAIVGSTKWVHFETGLSVRERLEWLDEPATGYGYRIIDGGDLPVTDFVGEVRITPQGPRACTVLMRCSFTSVGPDAGDWANEWTVGESHVLEVVAARLGAAAFGPPAEDDDIKAIIRARSDIFEADFAAGDARRLVDNYYTRNPRVVAPDAPMMTGVEAAISLFSGLMDGFCACKLTQVDIFRSGDLAYELGEAIVTARDPAAPPMESRYMIIWKKVDNRWGVDIDFFGVGLLGLDSSAPR